MFKLVLIALFLAGCSTTPIQQTPQEPYCPETKRVNLYNDEGWSEFDELNLKIVVDNDKCMLNKGLPCVIEFQRQTKDHYYAICGEKRLPFE